MISDIDDQTEQLCLLLEDLVLLALQEGKLDVDVRRVRVTPILNKQIELLVLKCYKTDLCVAYHSTRSAACAGRSTTFYTDHQQLIG